MIHVESRPPKATEAINRLEITLGGDGVGGRRANAIGLGQNCRQRLCKTSDMKQNVNIGWVITLDNAIAQT